MKTNHLFSEDKEQSFSAAKTNHLFSANKEQSCLAKTKNIFCIIGTGTAIGKTYVTCSLLKHLSNQNKKVAALKPLASGLILNGGELINEDTAKLMQAINIIQTANDINPICYPDAIAPHIAAQTIASKSHTSSNNNTLSVKTIIAASETTIYRTTYDYLLIEGCGGLLVPLNDTETYLDLLKVWKFPVILTVGMHLGCLNHTLLTYDCLNNNNIPIVGWIANFIDPQMPYLKENLEFLNRKLPIPLLATVPYNQELQTTVYFNL